MFALPPLVFVLGKGGVGKTTVAAAMAVMCARRRERVALVEMGATQSSKPIARRAPMPTLITITPHEAFAEYVTEHVGSSAVYRKIFDNRFVHYFLDAIPGVNELMCLGKIWHLVTRESWNHVIVDLPATGHGLGFLSVPRVITKSVSRGPLYEQGRQIEATLEDSRMTGTILITHCEELPVNETLEAAEQLRALPMALTAVVANRVRAPALSDRVRRGVAQARGQCADAAAWQPLFAMADFVEAQWARQQQEHARVQAVFGERLYDLPNIDGASGWPLAATLADQMAGWS